MALTGSTFAALPPALADFILRLPKTETHLHLEGCLPLELLQRVRPELFRDAPPPWWEEGFRYPDFPSFEETLLAHAALWFTSPERYHEAARLIFRRQAGQGVRYVETSFHLGCVEWLGVPVRELVDAIRTAAPPGLEVRVFLGMLRNHYTAATAPLIESLADEEHLAGVDLHGRETLPLEPWTARVWARVRAAGKVTKAHAGEFGPAAHVREALEVLGVRRVQHGVRAVEDPAVVRRLCELDATCDVCPISNVKLGVAPSIAAHPLRALRAAGVRCTVSCDDTFSFGNRLVDEYAALAVEGGWTRRELAGLARAGFEVALLPAAERDRHLAAIAVLGFETS